VTHGIGLRDSRHNLKYWTRQPYMGFGVDAHSMLLAGPELKTQGIEGVRFATPDSLEKQLSAVSPQLSASGRLEADVAGRVEQLRSSRTLITKQAALEEAFFLRLRLNRGVCLDALQAKFGSDSVAPHTATIAELVEAGLLEHSGDRVRLTARGRLLSNEVFARFLTEEAGICRHDR
jgi:oxygen-independent coproporphyrinogen-3 oxidase